MYQNPITNGVAFLNSLAEKYLDAGQQALKRPVQTNKRVSSSKWWIRKSSANLMRKEHPPSRLLWRTRIRKVKVLSQLPVETQVEVW